jgi:2-haloacid dehalogenase
MKFLFDLGGVFFDWDPKYFYKDIILEKKELDFFLSEICNDEWNLKQDAGRSILEAENELISKFPNYDMLIKMYYKNHRKMIKDTYSKSIDILKFLKESQYLCFVLSNWSAETFVGMNKDFSFLNYFDGIIISGKEKLIKPNSPIYELAIKRFNLVPQETVFIDDKLENIEAAKNLNFNTIHLVNPNSIKKDIEKYIN